MTIALTAMPEEKRQAYLESIEITRMMCKEISMVFNTAIVDIVVYPNGKVVYEYSSEVEEAIRKIRQWFGAMYPVKDKK